MTEPCSFQCRVIRPFGMIVEADPSLAADPAQVPVELLHTQLRERQLVLLRGFRSLTPDEFIAFSARLGLVVTWEHGPFYELVPNNRPDERDPAHTRVRMALHWEGFCETWRADYQIFHCEIPPRGDGGETFFTNTASLLSTLSEEQLEKWARAIVDYPSEWAPAGYRHPLVTRHPLTGQPIVRFVEDDTDPSCTKRIRVDGLTSFDAEAVIARLVDMLYEPAHHYVHRWQPGDLLLSDNEALLHGRNAFTGARKLSRLLVVDRTVESSLPRHYHYQCA